MSDDLRAWILKALVKAPAASIRGDAENVAKHLAEPWDHHGQHEYYVHCALCRGEADTLADAVMAVFDEYAKLRPTQADPEEGAS